MILTTTFIATLLDVAPERLYKKCATAQGTHFAWVTREIIRNDWYGMGIDNQDYLLGLLRRLLNIDLQRGGKLVDALFMDGFIVYKTPYLNLLADMYAKRSPFLLRDRK